MQLAHSQIQPKVTYSIEEVAQLLGISLTFAYEAAKRGEIPSIKIGRRRVVPRKAFEKFLETEQKGARNA